MLIDWIRAVAKNSRRVATVCSGAFIAAAAGLLDGRTVTTHWAKAGKLTSIRTLGGHRRYRESEVRSLLEGNTNATVES